jgi:hypothetical protein
MRILTLVIAFFICSDFAIAQSGRKFVPGYVVDTKGNRMTGLIQSAPSGRGPIKGQGFIVYKANEKADKMELSASQIRYFVAGRDSFVVAPAPMNADWSRNELDFVQVLADEPTKVYVLRGAGRGGSGVGIEPSFGLGIGGGSYGGGFGAGGGIGISLGGGSGGRMRTTYYFGESPSDLSELTPQNFIDVMIDVVADEPQLVEQVQNGKYNINKTEALLYEYYRLKSQQVKGGQ